jgi:hypothetical protein
MRRKTEEMVIAHDIEWSDPTMELCWYRVEIGRLTNSAIGLLWRRNAPKTPALASIKIDNNQYQIETQGMTGLTEAEREALEKRLAEMELTPKNVSV